MTTATAYDIGATLGLTPGECDLLRAWGDDRFHSGITAGVRKAWDESQHPRDRGKFSEKPGGDKYGPDHPRTRSGKPIPHKAIRAAMRASDDDLDALRDRVSDESGRKTFDAIVSGHRKKQRDRRADRLRDKAGKVTDDLAAKIDQISPGGRRLGLDRLAAEMVQAIHGVQAAPTAKQGVEALKDAAKRVRAAERGVYSALGNEAATFSAALDETTAVRREIATDLKRGVKLDDVLGLHIGGAPSDAADELRGGYPSRARAIEHLSSAVADALDVKAVAAPLYEWAAELPDAYNLFANALEKHGDGPYSVKRGESVGDYKARLETLGVRNLPEPEPGETATDYRDYDAVANVVGDYHEALAKKWLAGFAEHMTRVLTPPESKAFDPAKHPRDELGQFASPGGTVVDAPKPGPDLSALSPEMRERYRAAIAELAVLFPAGVGHLLDDKGHIDEARVLGTDPDETTEALREKIEASRSEWHEVGEQVRDELREADRAEYIATADENLGQHINDTLFNGDFDGPTADVFSDAQDEIHGYTFEGVPEQQVDDLQNALGGVSDAYKALRDTAFPDHDGLPNESDYALDPDDVLLSDDDYEDLADQAADYAKSVEDYREKLAELKDEVRGTSERAKQLSDEFRADQRKHLDELLTECDTALACPKGDWEEMGVDETRDKVIDLAARARKLLEDMGGTKSKAFDPGEKQKGYSHELLAAMLGAVTDAVESGGDAEAVAESFRALIDDPERLAAVVSGNESKAFDPNQPRDVVGRFSKVPGGSKTAQNKERAAARRKTKEETRQRANELIRKISNGRLLPKSQPYTAEDLHALADHLPNMTVSELRRARAALYASFKGDRRKAQMVERLREAVRASVLEKRAEEQGFDAGELSRAVAEKTEPETPPSDVAAPAVPGDTPPMAPAGVGPAKGDKKVSEPLPQPQTITVSDFDTVRPVDLTTGSAGVPVTGGEYQPEHGGAVLLRTSPHREPVVRVPLPRESAKVPGRAAHMDIPEGEFGKLKRRFADAGVPFTQLPEALAAGFGTDKKATQRVEDYLGKSSAGETTFAAPPVVSPASEPINSEFDHAQAITRREVAKLAAKDAADALTTYQRAGYANGWFTEQGGHRSQTPEEQAEVKRLTDAKRTADKVAREAEADLQRVAKPRVKPPAPPSRAASNGPVTVRGNTFAVRDQLAKIPGAKFNKTKKVWTVPSEHADRARQLVAAAPRSSAADLLALSDAELAARGLVRTSGPRGPYVRRGDPEELNDHL